MSNSKGWTKDKPSKSGFYWARRIGAETKRKSEIVKIEIFVDGDKSEIQVIEHGLDYATSTKDFKYWLGPIELPDFVEGEINATR